MERNRNDWADQISWYSLQILLSDGFGILGQRNILSLSLLVVGASGIGSTLLIFLSASGVGCIRMVNHDNVEVSNLHLQVIHTNGRREKSKARSAHDNMWDLNPTVLVMAVTDTLTWDNAMEIVRVNYCVLDDRDNPHT